MNESAIQTVKEYIADLKPPKYRLKRSFFEQKTYSIWAAKEVLQYLWSHPDTPPIIAIEEFIEKMDKYSLKNRESSFIFSVAHDIAEDILDIFLAMY